MTCISGFLLLIWINAVSLKESNFPILYYYVDGRDKVAQYIDGYICYGGIEI